MGWEDWGVDFVFEKGEEVLIGVVLIEYERGGT